MIAQSPYKLLIPLLLLIFPTILLAAENVAKISFFRAIQDKAVYAKNPTKYEHRVIDDRTGKQEYYIERQPAYVIPKNTIESVTAKQIEKYTATGEPFQETKPSSESKSAPRAPKSYEITFKIKPPEGKRFKVFTETNKQGFFETMIGEQSIGQQEFDEPFELDQFGGLEFKVLMVQFDDRRLKEMLSPFKELVSWK